jgi:hypothetical protein
MKITVDCPAAAAALLAATTALVGCSSSSHILRSPEGVALAQGADAPLRVGVTRVIGSRIRPLAPVQLSSEEGTIAVRFARPRSGAAIARLDAESLAPLSPERPLSGSGVIAPPEDPAPVVLRDGRFVVCWKDGDPERGYRLMAQAWANTSTPLGPPVAVSSPEADVIGVPSAISVDGERVVAVFASSSDRGFDLLAVPLEVR